MRNALGSLFSKPVLSFLPQTRTDRSARMPTAGRALCLICCPRTSTRPGLHRTAGPPGRGHYARWRSGEWPTSWGPLEMTSTPQFCEERYVEGRGLQCLVTTWCLEWEEKLLVWAGIYLHAQTRTDLHQQFNLDHSGEGGGPCDNVTT